MIDLSQYREDFPILKQEVNNHPLIYFDSAATSQKPQAVIDALNEFYTKYNANIHRGLHTLSEKATTEYEKAREKLAKFVNVSPSEVIFTKGTTEGINLVFYSWGRKNITAKDAILVTEMEHHSNLVPWHLLQKETGCQLKCIPVTPEGTLDLSKLDTLLQDVKLVAVTHVSNVLGTINPIVEIAQKAHQQGALVLVDGAQAAPHIPVDIPSLECDFYAFSSHKMCGPTGVGVLWGKTEILKEMDPFLGGGEMIHHVSWDHSTYKEVPFRFEAGTMCIAQAIGFGAAVDYLSSIGMDKIALHEEQMTKIALEKLQKIEGLTIYGQAPQRGAAISFTVESVHPHDLSTILDQQGIAIRAGHHCAQPLMKKLNIQSTARASLYFYNTPEEIEQLVKGIEAAKEIFAHVAK